MTTPVGATWASLLLAAALLASCVAAPTGPATPTPLPATRTGASTSPSGPPNTPTPPLATAPRRPIATAPPSPTQPTEAATPTPRTHGGATPALVIADGATAPPFPLVVGDSVVPDAARPSRALPLRRCDSAPDCAGAAQLGPRTLISPDGRYILYQAFEANGLLKASATPVADAPITPTLRLLDLQTGADRLLVAGARDPALGRDGRVAYVRGEPPAQALVYPHYYVGPIVVRPSFDGPETPWTSGAGQIGCGAWARDRLICGRTSHPVPYSTRFDLLVLVGPHSHWLLAPHDATLIALSPDGARALVTTDYGAPGFGAVAHLVRVADGTELSRLVLPPPLENLGPDGEWVGDRVVATSGSLPGGARHPPPYLVILRIEDDRLVVEYVLGFGPPERLGGVSGTAFEGIGQPRFIGADPDHVGMWFGGARLEPERYLECHLDVGSCRLGPPPSAGSTFLENPSRPLPRGSTSP